MSFRGNPNVVNMTDNQTINGSKNFKNYQISNTNYDVTDSATSNYGELNITHDKNGVTLGVECMDLHNNILSHYIQAAKYVNGTWVAGGSIGCCVNLTTNDVYGSAPASDVNGSIVTTTAKNKAANGYFKFGNGLIVQWGYKGGNGAYTITLSTPFSTTNYAPVFSNKCYNSNPTTAGIIKSITSTNFSINIPTSMDGVYWIAIGY